MQPGAERLEGPEVETSRRDASMAPAASAHSVTRGTVLRERDGMGENPRRYPIRRVV